MSDRKEIVIPEKYNKYKDKDGKIPLWSYSKVSGIEGCTWEYYLNRILKKKGVNNSYGILGGVAHDCLEKYYNKEITYDGMVDEFEKEWLACEIAGIKLFNDEEKNAKMMEDYKHDILEFFKTHKDLGKVLTEREIWIDVNGNVFFGYIDALTKIDGKTYILDWKTSTIYKGDDIRLHQHQLVLYAMGLMEMGVKMEDIRIGWNFLKYTNITFKHMITVTYNETVKDKVNTKTSTCYKNEWVSKIKTQLKKDISENNPKLTNKELKAMVDKCVNDNSLDSLPKEIQDKYKLGTITKTLRRSKWAKETPIQTQLKKDLKANGVDSVTETIVLADCARLNSLEPLKDLIDITNYEFSDAYVYGTLDTETIEELKKSLCKNIELIKSKGTIEENWKRGVEIEDKDSFYCSVLCSQRNNCKYYKKWKETQEMFTADGYKEVDEDTSSLLDELMNL